MMDGLDDRRKRALYRATHRGTKEMDWLLGRYAGARLAALSDGDLGELERLMELPEPALQHWLMTGSGYDGSEFTALIDRIRTFHGLGERGGDRDGNLESMRQRRARAGPAAEAETLTGVPEGYDGYVLAQLASETSARLGSPQAILHVARDDRRLGELEAALAFFAPKVKVVSLPAWDTVPYDRIGPNSEIAARRITALTLLAAGTRKEPTVVLTTVNAVLQRLPPRDFLKRSLRQIAPGQRIDRAELIERLTRAGYVRTGTVMEPGEFAVRGSLIDLFPPGRQTPVRLDFFDDTLESIKSFDVETQRTAKAVQRLLLTPMSEVPSGDAAASRFRQAYVAVFGANNTGRSALRGGERRAALSGRGALAAAVPRHARDAARLSAGGAGQPRSHGRGIGARSAGADHGALRGPCRGAGDVVVRRAALQAAAAG